MATRAGRFARSVVFVNALVPVAMLVWDGARGALGANPLEFVLRTTGLLALFFLVLSLAVTPVRRLVGLPSIAQHRRALGLFAFFYATLHLLAYAAFDKGLNPTAILADTVDRPFITVGMACFMLLVPLAVTSTNGMIRRLGGARWRRLHRLVYVIAVGAVLHFYMLVKADTRTPLLYAAVVAVLLLVRVIAALRARTAQLGTGQAEV